MFRSEKDLWHESTISQLVSVLKPKLSLEIGIAKGRTSKFLSRSSQQVIGIDIDPESKNYVDRLSNYRALIGDSVEILNQLREELKGKLDLAFIDGNHKFEIAYEDFKLCLEMLSPGGIILLHDTHPKSIDFVSDKNEWCGTAYRLPSAIRTDYPMLQVITFPVHPGLTLVQNFLPQPLWMNY
jgi:predicted O-methyltransferase YrrM